MASVRLNGTHRDELVRRLTEGKFQDELDKLDDMEAQLAYDIYLDKMGEDLEGVNKAPDHWFDSGDQLGIYFGETFKRIHFASTKQRKEGKRLMYKMIPRLRGAVKVSARSTFKKRFDKIVRERDRIKKERANLRLEVRTAVGSATTAKKLVENWPEIEKIVDEVVGQKTTCTAVAVPIAQLNKKLGLK